MSYYILPKNNNNITIKPLTSDATICEPYLSYSIYNYFNEIKEQIIDTCICESDETVNTFEKIITIVNPYEYVFSVVPGTVYSVSKLKPKTNIFYDFLEVATILNIFDSFKNNSISSLHITKNYEDTIECLEMLREDFHDSNDYLYNVNDETLKEISNKKYDFIFFETENENLQCYIKSFIEIVIIILRNQNKNGLSVIKINHIFHKPIVDLIYLLSSSFEKSYIIKPHTSNITNFDKYIICKNFIIDENKLIQYKNNFIKLSILLKKIVNKNIHSILECDIPYYFTIKLDDMNVINGQSQLETLNNIITIFKNKNKDEKIEVLKKINIQRSINWCEKYKIPCNKFSDKCNIFLPNMNDTYDKKVDTIYL
jgi:hypothetical protein